MKLLLCSDPETKLVCFLICGVQAELESALRKMDADKVKHEQKLQHQTQLLDSRAAKIRKLEGSMSAPLAALS